jgi:long-chain acyl-CoA synthetase
MLFEMLRDLARRAPGRPALRAGDEALTCGDFAEAIERKADAIPDVLPLVVLDGADPIRFLVDFFAASARRLPAIAHPPAATPVLRRMREAAALEGVWPSGGATAFFSSGSVGPSKAVPLSAGNLAAAALAFESWGEVAPEDSLAVGLSPAQVFAFVRGALNGLLLGAEVVFFTPRRDPLAEAAALGATAALVPSAFVVLAARGGSRVALKALRCGGGNLPEAAADEVERVRGVPVRSGYGLTESAGLAARQPGSRPRRRGSSGLIAPGMAVSIVGEDGSDRPAGESGEIRLEGAAVFDGYLGLGDGTPFDDRARLRTGDVGSIDAEGELRVRGRLAFSLAVGDRILCAEEVESAMAEHPAVTEAVASPFERSFGVLVVAADTSDALLDELRAHAERRLPAFARPRRIVRVAEIPRTPGGKVDRVEASRWLSERRASVS